MIIVGLKTIHLTVYFLEADLEDFFINPEDQTVYVGNVTTLTCVSGKGAPPPVIMWEKDGDIIEVGSQEVGVFGEVGYGGVVQMSAVLQLTVDRDTEGVYTCLAENPLTGQVIVSHAANTSVIGV